MNPKFMFTVRDVKVGKIGPIFVLENDDVAERAVRLAIKSDSIMARCPADFELLCIGQIDDNTGKILTAEIRQVALVTELVPYEN